MPKTNSKTSTVVEETPVSTVETIVQERDEFSDPSFLDHNARLPRLQALRGISPENCGYFISVDEMAKAGWLSFDNLDLTTYTFESSGEREDGLLIPNPRMLVCPRTPLLAFDRQASQENEQLVILGTWKREYKEDENVGNCQAYEVILLSKENKPLHQVPFSYVAKGANHATFSQEWQKFILEMTTCHAISNGIAARPKNGKFNSLCAFSFQTGRELAGTKRKSPCCKVISHDVPNLENWHNYFVGYNQTMKLATWENLQPIRPLLIPGETTPTPALPSAPSDED